mgnify:FL=1
MFQERGEYLSGWQRAKADYINLQRESDTKRIESIQFASERIIMELLPVLDSFEMAMANKEAWGSVSENWRTGIEYIKNQFSAVLISHGIAEICPKEKDDVKFEHHVVVEVVSMDDKSQDGKIATVLQKGYILNGKVLRPARVTAFLHNK